jgi:hypothetical protein
LLLFLPYDNLYPPTLDDVLGFHERVKLAAKTLPPNKNRASPVNIKRGNRSRKEVLIR